MFVCTLHAVIKSPGSFLGSLCNTALALVVSVTLREPASTKLLLQAHSLCYVLVLLVALL